MKLWLDAQLSPEIAPWISRQFGVEAIAVRDVGLRDAEDADIFTAAREADAVLLTKDSDFSIMVQRLGTPPRLIWLRCGNTSNESLRRVLDRTLREALSLIEGGETLVEIAER